MSSSQAHPISPDLFHLMLVHRDQPLSFCYGIDEQGQPIATTLQQAAPLLVIDSTRQAHVHLLGTILAQLYTKTDGTRLRVLLIEQRMQLTPVFETGPLTTLSVKSESGLLEALDLLEHEIRHREGRAGPPWLVMIELAASFYQRQDVRHHLSTLLEDGHACGIYPVLIATGHDVVRAHLPMRFSHTVVLPVDAGGLSGQGRTTRRGILLRSPEPAQGQPPSQLSIPRITPGQITQCIGFLTASPPRPPPILMQVRA